MNNKKGFTLVEVLAVVAILGILVLISLPNIVEAFKSSKRKNFVSEVQGVYKTAKNAYVLDSAKGHNNIVYFYGFDETSGVYSKELDVSNRQGFKYMIRFGEEGEIYYFIVEDSDFSIELGDINTTSAIVEFKEIANAPIEDTSTSTPQTITSSTTSSTVATSQVVTSCDPGFYLSSGSCVRCSIGRYCIGGTAGPVDCPSGTISSAGASSIDECTAAPSISISKTTPSITKSSSTKILPTVTKPSM